MVVLSAYRSNFGSVDKNFGCYFKELTTEIKRCSCLKKFPILVLVVGGGLGFLLFFCCCFVSMLMLSVLQRRLETFHACQFI